MAVISECVVGCKKIDDNFIVAKNRDRSYSPVTKIVHHVDEENELIFLFDEDTRYAEGLNVRSGFGILNTATENSEDFEALPSDEGLNIMRALICQSAKAALKSMVSAGSEVYGNTLVTDGDNSYILEFVKGAKPVIKNATKRKYPTVRTNHTLAVPDGGFKLGEDDQDYISSKTRRAVAEVVFTNSDSVEDLLDSLNYNVFGDHSAYDLHRNTTGYKTCSQIALDPAAKTVYYRAVPGREDFTGVQCSGNHKLPKDGKIQILDYREEVEAPFLTWGSSMHTLDTGNVNEVMLHRILDPTDDYADTTNMSDVEVAKLSADDQHKNLEDYIRREAEIIKKLVAIQDLIRNKDTAMLHLLSGLDVEKEYDRICALIDKFEEKAMSLFLVRSTVQQNDVVNEADKRKPRKKGQHRNSPSHSDLFTDENPVGTIKGLKFATVKDATTSVNKIKRSGKTHNHKTQAAIAMEQRAKSMGKKSSAAVFRKFINQQKEKTKKMNESAIKILLREYIKDAIK